MVFRKLKNTSGNEDESKGPEKIEFEIMDEGVDFVEEELIESEEEVDLQTPAMRRSDHERRLVDRYSPPDFHSTFVLSTVSDEPKSVKEAVNFEECKLWKNAMVEEMEALDKNEVWDLVELPDGRKPIGSKWAFKKKLNSTGKVEKYKARLIAKGYSQVEGIDFGEIFSHVVKMTSIRFLLCICFICCE